MEGKLKEMEEQEFEGAMLMSKAKYLVEGEKFTKFVLIWKKREGKLKC